MTPPMAGDCIAVAVAVRTTPTPCGDAAGVNAVLATVVSRALASAIATEAKDVTAMSTRRNTAFDGATAASAWMGGGTREDAWCQMWLRHRTTPVMAINQVSSTTNTIVKSSSSVH